MLAVKRYAICNVHIMHCVTHTCSNTKVKQANSENLCPPPLILFLEKESSENVKFKGGGYPHKVLTTSTYEPRHEKTNILVSDQVRHKPGCTATEGG